MDITIYVLDSEGYLSCKRVGNPDNLMYAVEFENKAYTLTPPPNSYKKYKWVINEWILEGETETTITT